MNKVDFMNRIRSSLHRKPEDVFAQAPKLLGVITDYKPKGLVGQFKEEYEAVGGNFHLVKTKKEATEKVLEIIKSLKAKSFISSNDKYIKSIVAKTEIAKATKDSDADVGITAAHCLIANTGTLVLESSVGRVASLLPPNHIAIVKAEQLVPTMAEAIENLSDLPSMWVQATGPSRTADIELTLTIGVHAPGVVHVVMIA